MIRENSKITEIKKMMEDFKHPNISFRIYEENYRYKDIAKADKIYPITDSFFVLFNLNIKTSDPIFTEQTNYKFIYKHILITSSMGLKYWYRSDDALDATATSCTIRYEKTGINNFELFFNIETEKHQLVLNLNDGNRFYSVAFKTETPIPENFIKILNDALLIDNWKPKDSY